MGGLLSRKFGEFHSTQFVGDLEPNFLRNFWGKLGSFKHEICGRFRTELLGTSRGKFGEFHSMKFVRDSKSKFWGNFWGREIKNQHKLYGRLRTRLFGGHDGEFHNMKFVGNSEPKFWGDLMEGEIRSCNVTHNIDKLHGILLSM